MPLSEPAPRELLHTRAITLHGYRRADGLFDIEADLADSKSYGFFMQERGWLEPGEKLHGMKLRMTLNEDMVITEFTAVTEYAPFSICPAAATAFSRLAGLKVGPGFLKAAAQRVGGTQGCTHLREVLQQMGTVAFQTLFAVRERKRAEAEQAGAPPARSPLINTCYAYASDGPVVKQRWPHLYTGKEDAPGSGEAGTAVQAAEG